MRQRRSLDITVFALEREVQAAWKVQNFDLAAFASVASEALENALAGGRITQRSLLDWLAESPPLPKQPRLDQTFGQPPITLAWNGAFQIDMLFWSAAGTAIHGHGFAGAFGVVGGESLHFNFQFAEKSRPAEHFRIGSLKRNSVERLFPGAVRQILAGSDIMHALVHLGRPSVSIVVRTCGNAPGIQEMVAFPPTVTLSPLPEQSLRVRQMQMLDMLLTVAPEKAEKFANAILKQCDIHTAFKVLCSTDGRFADGVFLDRLGIEVMALLAAVRQNARRQRADALFRRVSDVRARALLALLLFNSNAAAIMQDIVNMYPEEDCVIFVGEALARLVGIGLESSEDRSIAVMLGKEVAIAAGKLSTEDSHNEVDSLCKLLAEDILFNPLFTLCAD